jgi:hypothetical protein
MVAGGFRGRVSGNSLQSDAPHGLFGDIEKNGAQPSRYSNNGGQYQPFASRMQWRKISPE